MILISRSDEAIAATTETVAAWCLPWQARLKDLADAMAFGVLHGALPVTESAHTWLERIRIKA